MRSHGGDVEQQLVQRQAWPPAFPGLSELVGVGCLPCPGDVEAAVLQLQIAQHSLLRPGQLPQLLRQEGQVRYREEVRRHGHIGLAVQAGVPAYGLAEAQADEAAQPRQVDHVRDGVFLQQLAGQQEALQRVAAQVLLRLQVHKALPEDFLHQRRPPAVADQKRRQGHGGIEAGDTVVLLLPTDGVGVIPVAVQGKEPALLHPVKGVAAPFPGRPPIPAGARPPGAG